MTRVSSSGKKHGLEVKLPQKVGRAKGRASATKAFANFLITAARK